MPQPVALARLLAAHGVTLRKAHLIIDRLAEGMSYATTLITDDPLAFQQALEGLGLNVSTIARPDIDAKAVREGYALSQKDFATRFGLELRTIQNWEQRRNRLDPTAAILLALIRDRPDAVEGVLTLLQRPR